MWRWRQKGEGDYEEQRQKVLSILSRLGLHESIRSSYLELLEEKNERNNEIMKRKGRSLERRERDVREFKDSGSDHAALRDSRSASGSGRHPGHLCQRLQGL